MERGTMSERFPQIYIIAQQKDINICDSLVRTVVVRRNSKYLHRQISISGGWRI